MHKLLIHTDLKDIISLLPDLNYDSSFSMYQYCIVINQCYKPGNASSLSSLVDNSKTTDIVFVINI